MSQANRGHTSDPWDQAPTRTELLASRGYPTGIVNGHASGNGAELEPAPASSSRPSHCVVCGAELERSRRHVGAKTCSRDECVIEARRRRRSAATSRNGQAARIPVAADVTAPAAPNRLEATIAAGAASSGADEPPGAANGKRPARRDDHQVGPDRLRGTQSHTVGAELEFLTGAVVVGYELVTPAGQHWTLARTATYEAR